MVENTTIVGNNLYTDLRKVALTQPAHQPLASERALSKQFSISYSTVRRVVSRLVDEGLLYKHHGKGVFVAERAALTKGAGPRSILYIDDWMYLGHPYCERKLRGVMDAAEACGLRVEVRKFPEWSTLAEDDHLCAEIQRPELAGLIVPWLAKSVRSVLTRRKEPLQVVATHARGSLTRTRPTPGEIDIGFNASLVGYQAASYFHRKGARRAVAALKSAEFAEGFEQARREGRAGLALTLVPAELRGDPAALAARLADLRPDALLFDDDRTACAVLAVLERTHPDLRPLAASTSNAGERILPGHVLRFECDGYDLGQLAVTLVRSVLDCQRPQTAALFLDPKVLPPDDDRRPGDTPCMPSAI